MSHHVNARFATSVHALIVDAVASVGGATGATRFGGSFVVVRCGRGEHELEISVQQARMGGAKWSVTARRSGASAELSVRPELPGEGFDKLLGLTLDLCVGDAQFDQRFIIEAAPAAVATHLLDASLRASLSRLPPSDDGPALRLSSDVLTLRWTGGITRDDLSALLSSLFECLDRCRALHEALATADVRAPFRASSGGSAAVDPERRAADRASMGRARRRAAAFIASVAVAGAAFLASALSVGR